MDTSLSEDFSGFALKTVIMGNDGSLRDWDGIVGVPQCIGCDECLLSITSCQCKPITSIMLQVSFEGTPLSMMV